MTTRSVWAARPPKKHSKEYLRGRRAGATAAKRRALKKLRRWRTFVTDQRVLAEYDDIIAELFRP